MVASSDDDGEQLAESDPKSLSPPHQSYDIGQTRRVTNRHALPL
jgi:hypothetical protein